MGYILGYNENRTPKEYDRLMGLKPCISSSLPVDATQLNKAIHWLHILDEERSYYCFNASRRESRRSSRGQEEDKRIGI